MLETKEKSKKDKEQSVTKEGSAPATEPAITVMSELDRLKAENAQLRLMNESARYASIARDLANSGEQVNQLRAFYTALLKELAVKYRFNPDETEMEPSTGRILPRGTLPR